MGTASIALELIWSGIIIFVIDLIFSVSFGLLLLFGYFDSKTVGYLLDAGIKLSFLSSGLILLGVLLLRFAKEKS
jgi:hypothetical protein